MNGNNLPAIMLVIKVINVETSKLQDCAQNMFSIMRGIFLLQHTAIIAIDIVKRDFDGLPTFFVNSETKSPSSTLTEQVPRESFSTVCLDFRITTTKAALMKVSCVPFHQLWPNSNFLCKFSVQKQLKDPSAVNTILFPLCIIWQQ